MGFLIPPGFEGDFSPGPSLALRGEKAVLLPSHSPLALALKVIDLLHLHPFDTCDQGRKEVGKGSPRPCSEGAGLGPQARRVEEALTEIFHQEGEEAWWGDKSGWWSGRRVPGPPCLPNPRRAGVLLTRVALQLQPALIHLPAGQPLSAMSRPSRPTAAPAGSPRRSRGP